MLFADSAPRNQLNARQLEERLVVVDTILRTFSVAFPGLQFELLGQSKIINAQALVSNGQRQIKIYGGLAFHPFAGGNVIGFILLHEVGHHLAEGHRLPGEPSLACECAADHWAVTSGLRILAASGWSNFSLETAMGEFDMILAWYSQFVDIPAYCNKGTMKDDGCWALDWTGRRRNLFAAAPVRIAVCPLEDLVLSSSKKGG
jgi:hypothetical protein